MKKAKVIRPFNTRSSEYKYGDVLDLEKANYGVKLVKERDSRKSICEVGSIYFDTFMEIIEVEEEIPSREINLDVVGNKELLTLFKTTIESMVKEEDDIKKTKMFINLEMLEYEILDIMNGLV